MTTIVVPTLDRHSAHAEECSAAIVRTAPVPSVVFQVDARHDGFSHTCNLGAKEAHPSTNVLVFLNDDTIPQQGWLEPLTEAATEYGIAGSHLVYPNGQTQHSGIFLRRDHLGRLEAYNRKRPAASGEVPAVTGACLAIRRDLWDELGGFDESFRNGYEDIDLCLRARQAGHSVWFCAESVVVHLESQSPPELRFGHARENIELLQQRWGHLPI